MSKKKFKFIFDCPFTVIFAAICTTVFLLDTFALKGKAISYVFSCPGARGFDTFKFNNVLHYFRILFHVFGNQDPFVFLTNIMVLLFLGSQMETKYGIPALALMTGISALVSGVLNACVCSTTAYGSECVIFMLIFLCAADSLMKRDWEISRILTLLVYIAFILYSSFKKEEVFSQSLLYMLISLVGGISGGLIGFLVAPKKIKDKSPETKKTETREAPKPKKEKKQPRIKQKKFKKAKLDETVSTETDIVTL